MRNVLIIKNSVPNYYIIFNTEEDAQNFRFLLVRLFEKIDRKIKCRLINEESPIMSRKLINSCKIKNLSEYICNALLRDMSRKGIVKDEYFGGIKRV